MVDIATNDDGSIDYENVTIEEKMALIAEAQGDLLSEIKAMFWEKAAGVDERLEAALERWRSGEGFDPSDYATGEGA